MRKAFISTLLIVCLTTNLYALETDEKLAIYGYVSQGYMISDTNNYLVDNSNDGSFQFREMGITFSSQIQHNFRIGAQLAAFDLGDVGNNEPTLDWAYGDYQISEYFGIRAGRVKGGGVGLYNETVDIDIVRTSIFPPPSVYNPLQRDSLLAVDGIAFYGELMSFPWYIGSFSYFWSFGSTSLIQDGLTNKFIASFNLIENPESEVSETMVANLSWSTPLDGLRIKLSHVKADLTVTGKQTLHIEWKNHFPNEWKDNYDGSGNASYKISPYSLAAYSAEYVYNNLTFAYEEAHQTISRRLYLDTIRDSVKLESKNLGRYFSTAYRFSEWLELGLSYGEYYSNKDDKDGKNPMASASNWMNLILSEDGDALAESNQKAPKDFYTWQKTASFTTRFDINTKWILKMEYSAINGVALLLPDDNPDRDDIKENWWLFSSKITFVF